MAFVAPFLPVRSPFATSLSPYSCHKPTFTTPLFPRLSQPIPHPLTPPKMSQSEQTFIAVKPDGMNRGLLGDVISRFEVKGYKLVAIKTIVPTRELAETHYASLSSKPFFSDLVDFITSGPVCAMVWEGTGIVAAARKMIGETKPLDSAPGTIRGDYGIDVGRNVIHGSDAVETAEREIALWFKQSELASWTPTASVWVYE